MGALSGRSSGEKHSVPGLGRALLSRNETGIQPLGPAAILAQHPFGQPMKTKRSFAPRVHAFSREVRKAMVRAWRDSP
jgi:hypothetical protein